MSSTHWAVIEPLSKSKLTNTMVEMSSRVAALAWYLREFIDRRGAGEFEKKQIGLQLELSETKQQLDETVERLLDAQASSDRLVEECG